jgi:Fe-S-cluster-containing hydrogenase component 2
MAVRKIVRIDEEKCDGCGLCVPSCAEGAIQVIDGKARLVSETYCDGLGACLGDCPLGAITVEEREASDFDVAAVEKHLKRIEQKAAMPQHAAPSCPGSAMRQFGQKSTAHSSPGESAGPSQLNHWPIQLMLVPPGAPFLKDADLLICADCVPFTVPDFHQRYLAGRALLVGCPKLDDLQFYFEKLKDIFAEASPRKITVLKMEVPCCSGIAQAAIQARNEVIPDTEIDVHTIGIRGDFQCETIPAGTAA